MELIKFTGFKCKYYKTESSNTESYIQTAKIDGKTEIKKALQHLTALVHFHEPGKM
jgi:hypothetical protein